MVSGFFCEFSLNSEHYEHAPVMASGDEMWHPGTCTNEAMIAPNE